MCVPEHFRECQFINRCQNLIAGLPRRPKMFRVARQHQRTCNAQRRYVRCRAQRTVFQADAPSTIMSIDEIKVLLDYTSKNSEKNNREIFYSMGLDYDQVRKYYNSVAFMERMYEKSQDMPKPVDIEFARYYEYMRRIVTVLMLLVSGRF